MPEPRLTILGVAAAALLAAAGPATAQQEAQDLSREAVTSFVEKLEQDAEKLVRDGDYQRLTGWAKDNIADEARIFASEDINVGDRRKASIVVSLDKQDIVRLSGAMAGMMAGLPKDAVQDYALDIEVLDVKPIGPNAAIMTTRIVESGKFVLSAASPAVANEAAGPEGRSARPVPVEMRAEAECDHLVRRSGEERPLMLGLTACQVTVQL